MPPLPIKRLAGIRGQVALTIATRIAREGQRRWESLSERDRAEIARLVRKSKGLPGNLSAHERTKLKRIVTKAVRERPKG